MPRIEIVEIATGEVVHMVPCPNVTPGTHDADRVLRGVLNHVGKFDCRLSRGGHEVVDDRLDLDRYFARMREEEGDDA